MLRKFTSEETCVHFCNCLYIGYIPFPELVWPNMITVCLAVFAFMFVFVLFFLSLLGSAWLTCAQLYLGVNSPIACVALTLCGNLHPSVHMDDVDQYWLQVRLCVHMHWLQVQLYVHTCIGCKYNYTCTHAFSANVSCTMWDVLLWGGGTS